MNQLCGLFAVLLLASTCTAIAADLEQARRLMEQGKAEDAFLLLAEEQEPADDPEFDYIYGIAALDSGRAGIALFAFERVLAADPNHIYARAELGRALFQLDEYREALQEFEKVRALDAPPEVTAKLDQYEAALRQAAPPSYQLGGYIEAMFGYDTNFNSATSDSSVAIPAFGNIIFTLDDLFTEDESIATGGRGGVYFATPLSERSTLIANVDIAGADYPDANAGFYYVNLRGHVGIHHRIDANDSITIGATGFSSWLQDLNYLHAYGGAASWRHDFNDRDGLDTFLRISKLNHDEVIEFRDVMQYLSGVTLSRRQGRQWWAGIGIFGSAEIESRDSRSDVGREIYGARGFARYLFIDRIAASASITGQFSDYRGVDGLFLTTRDDELVLATVSFDYRVTPRWSV